MSTLIQKTPKSEYLTGILFIKDKLTGDTQDGISFNYRNPSSKEVDQIIEQQPIKGLQMDKKTNVIYTSAPLVFQGSYELDLEDQDRLKKVKKVLFDHKNSKKTDMRMKDIGDKTLYLGKLITLE